VATWDEFATAEAPRMDIIVTVCDAVSGESCPYWPDHPLRVHWGIPDPAAVDGTDAEIAHAFNEALRMLERRIKVFLALPIKQLDAIAIKRELDAIVSTLVALVEPLVLLVMGGLVLMMVLAILLPIINLNNLVGL